MGGYVRPWYTEGSRSSNQRDRSVLLFPHTWPIILEQEQELAFQLADVLKLHVR